MRTPHHTTGPFFPSEFIDAGDHDLTRVAGRPAAAGDHIEVAGRVLDGRGRPAVNVILELWQADAHGVFHDPRDPRYAGRDPGFRGWGRTWTDRDGQYRFVTVRPAAYPSGTIEGWIRPPHLRFTLLGSGLMRPLVTEVYFPGEPLNDADKLWLAMEVDQRARALARPEQAAPGVSRFGFDIVLQGERETPFFED